MSVNDPLGAFLQSTLGHLRRITADGPPPAIDRTLATATLLTAAAIVAWPGSPPRPIVLAAQAASEFWRRRTGWQPTS